MTRPAAPWIGVAIRRMEQGHLHCGFAYRRTDGKEHCLELQWDCDMIDGPLHEQYHVIIHRVPAAKARPALVLAQRVLNAHKRKKVRYSWSLATYLNRRGFAASNDLNDVVGLSCATFVVAVLGMMSIDLVDPDTWPYVAEDAEWQSFIIAQLEKSDPGHAERLRRASEEWGGRRIRPADVAAAAAEDATDLPVVFEDARAAGETLDPLLDMQNVPSIVAVK